MIKTVILAGGLGTRLSEETHLKPKPMVEIGGRPILWHIMKIYSHYNFNDFIVCCGYKGYIIKEYFANYSLHNSDITFNLSDNKIEVHTKKTEPWKITLIDTGEKTMTGGRLARVKDYLKNDEPFFFTYGDGLANIDLNELLHHHYKEERIATLSAVKPPGRFGAISLADNNVLKFQEKPEGDKAWINGGFFVLDPEIFNLIKDDNCIWEKEPLEILASKNQLSAYKHKGFWQPMDTLRDKNKLNEMWENDNAPWKLWD